MVLMAAGKNGKKLTPMMAQYQTIRRSLPDDIILLFRLGDFYEMFFDDAKEASALIGVALTKRGDIPMCGVPHHAAKNYIAKLVKANKRVAIAEQTTLPEQGKIVEREVAQIISAGTIADVDLLDEQRPNYIAAVMEGKKNVGFGLACLDHTTGEFTLAECDGFEQLRDELARLMPSEVLVADNAELNLSVELSKVGLNLSVQVYDSYAFMEDQAAYNLQAHFKVQSLAGFGVKSLPLAVSAAGGIWHYLTFQLRRSVDHVRQMRVRQLTDHVLIDASSQRNLDLVEPSNGADRKHTLLAVLDRTKTPMGARRLRDWILHPIRDLRALQQRQQFIGAAVDEAFLLSQCQDTLKSIRDIERTSSRLSQNSGNARDLRALSSSLAALPTLKTQLLDFPNQAGLASELVDRLADFSDLVNQLETTLCEEPVAGTKDGGMIAEGCHAELDQLRSASTEGKNWMAELQHKERERTGIDSLKIKYNNVFGYFIEITKAKVDLAPEDYQRKQTMANAERFITPELKQMENKILGADDRANKLEYEIFCELREEVKTRLTDLQNTSDSLSDIDVLLGLAQVALTHNHCCPELDESCDYDLVNARHPVLEQTLVDEPFIPNDTRLEAEHARLMILTGPNMAGKSTYIRQVALIAVMAQMGAFVPAESARIGLVDRIFCRVGASDNLAGGQSTFMVEMSETALILNNATDRSLVILDEIGRGTATYDGLSIAWSVAEYLHDVIKARSLFATHYHEMTDLSKDRPAIRNFYVAVREWNEEIIFLRKILEGTADRSYGIQVAKLAGIPSVILDRAKSILHELEFGQENAKPGSSAKVSLVQEEGANIVKESDVEFKPKPATPKRDSSQMSFF